MMIKLLNMTDVSEKVIMLKGFIIGKEKDDIFSNSRSKGQNYNKHTLKVTSETSIYFRCVSGLEMFIVNCKIP